MGYVEIESYRIANPEYLRRHLAETQQVYQQVEVEPGNSQWLDMSAEEVSDQLLMDRPLTSPKSLFFAEQENVFSFDGEVFRETLPEVESFVVFGVHSCDLTGIAYQDQFFKDDPYYQARRQKALLVGIDCVKPCKQGFCVAVDAGPDVRANTADLILHPVEQEWLLLVTSEKGRKAIAGMECSDAQTDDQSTRAENIKQCQSQFKDLYHIETGIKQLLDDSLPSSFWEEAGIQCLSCSGCTSLCPTCSCYSTRELPDDQGFNQQRFWDSCLYEAFQREASQHNPSKQAGSRLRRFWTHKFSQSTLNTFGRYGCVGCGRCDMTCPGVIGAHAIMKRMVSYGE